MKDIPFPPHKSSLGINANVLLLLIYIAMMIMSSLSFTKYLVWVVPLAVFIIEKNSAFVKFYAVQAFFIGIVRAVISGLFLLLDRLITPSDAALSGMKTLEKNRILGAKALANDIDNLIGIAIIALFIYLAIMGYSYIRRELPKIGRIARNISKISDEDNS
jgi:uncharacterized membrane protein